ncbi:ABC transporter substrate-binding protein [uncultured Roseibium sp.]|uniref:ABC transporter substrate-binding protein n=1 Tax=uncultured Roseibium sp. TaxID=1936171 RepID=UPI002599DF84|nr:ABC transporter substrate-binding protein [uncultured Roseibium sp.]
MKFPVSLAVAALIGVAVSNAPVSAGTMQDALSRGTLRVGIAEENFVPWLANDKSGGRMGFEIDVATSVADALQLTPEFVEMPFDQLLRGLTIGQLDVVISGMSVSADRAREVLFTAPYSSTDFSVVVDKTALPEGAEDNGFDVEGMKLGVAGDTLADYAASSEFQLAEVMRYDNNGDLRDAFLNGDVQGVIVPTPYPEFIVSRDPDRFAAEAEPLVSTLQAMAVRPGSERFVNFLNAWLMENTANGTLGDMRSHWFQSLDWLDRLEGHDAPASEEESAPAAAE